MLATDEPTPEHQFPAFEKTYKMNKHSVRATHKSFLHYLAGLAFVFSFGGCSEDADGPSTATTGGARSTNGSEQGGSTPIGETGGSTTAEQATGGLASATGGATQLGTVDTSVAGTGGATQSGTGGAAQVATGGAAQVATGGAAQVVTGGAAQVVTGGAAPVVTGGAAQVASGGATQSGTGGATQAESGGATQIGVGGSTQASTGGAVNAGTGGATESGTGGNTQTDSGTPDVESLCFDENGGAVPYDFSIGLIGEYAFEVSMSCDIGGYLMPLVMADPVYLTEVNLYVAEATDWYRAAILKCTDAATQLDENSYGLLPVSQSSDLSEADFNASLALFLMVLDRHQGLADGVSAENKEKITNRINSFKSRAVDGTVTGLTKTLTEPDCVPTAPAGNGG